MSEAEQGIALGSVKVRLRITSEPELLKTPNLSTRSESSRENVAFGKHQTPLSPGRALLNLCEHGWCVLSLRPRLVSNEVTGWLCSLLFPGCNFPFRRCFCGAEWPELGNDGAV